MTGPEHYEAAERLLAQAATDYENTFMDDVVAAAQAHATLALADFFRAWTEAQS